MPDESAYIKKRLRNAKWLSARFKLMQIFPIKKKKIVFSAFEGDGGFCCNPRYIAEELHKRNNGYEMIWLVHDMSKEFPEYIKVAKDTLWNTAYHLSTAHFWIDNYRKPLGTLKRKGQIYLQTWHASLGFKAVGLYRGDSFPEIAKIVSEWDSKLIDYVISNSDYCDDVYPKKLLYSGPTLRTGTPRVDCLINDQAMLRKQIRDRYELGENIKLALYAPTFRGGNQKGKKQVTANAPSLNMDRLVESLTGKFSGEWKILIRLHPQLAPIMKAAPLEEGGCCIIDVSLAPDINEIMAACDIVITDYSSCAFDACFAGIPVLLYADDVQEYIKNRGQFMWKKEELPFAIAQTNDELSKNIMDFDYDQYWDDVKEFMKVHGIIEKGTASRDVVDWIEKCGELEVIGSCRRRARGKRIR